MKTLLLWLLITVVLTVIGYLTLWHGAVYLESAEYSGEPGYIYLAEVIIGSILLWPVTGTGWLSYFVTGDKGSIGFPTFILLQFGGYFCLYLIVSYVKRKAHNKNEETQSFTASGK